MMNPASPSRLDLSESQKDGGITAPWLHEAIGQTRILDMLSVAVYIFASVLVKNGPVSLG
jgi:hypothetical protein